MAITVSEITHSSVKKIDYTWTATTTGTTSGASVSSYDGELLRVVASNTVMAAGTIRLLDSDSNDLLMGAGVLTTGITYFAPTTGGAAGLGTVTNSPLTLEHTVSTTGGTGHVIVCIR